MNLLAPLTFGDAEIGAFIRDHACALCRSHLLQFPASDRQWIASCPVHGPIMSHNHVSKWQAQRATDNERAATVEINVEMRPRLSEDEILKSLGF